MDAGTTEARRIQWRRVDKYCLQGDGYSISRANVGPGVSYHLWRDPRREPDAGIKEHVRGVYQRRMPDLLRTINLPDAEDEAASLAAVEELKGHAEACLWADRTGGV